MVKDPSLGVGCCMDLGHSVRMGEDIVKDIKNTRSGSTTSTSRMRARPRRRGQTWEMGRGVMGLQAHRGGSAQDQGTRARYRSSSRRTARTPIRALPSRSDTCAAYATQRNRPCRQSLSYGGRTRVRPPLFLGYDLLHALSAIRTAPKKILSFAVYLDNTGCRSAKPNPETAFPICHYTHLSLYLII